MGPNNRPCTSPSSSPSSSLSTSSSSSSSPSSSFQDILWSNRKLILCWSLPIILLPIILLHPCCTPDDLMSIPKHGPVDTTNMSMTPNITMVTIYKSKAAVGAYVLLLMAIFWLTEVVPIAVTALIPIIVFPLMGVVESKVICLDYMKETVMIFIGSMVTAIAIEESGLHERIALRILMLFGTQPKWLLLGFMLNTSFLSMWISNTGATALMIPIINAVIEQLKQGASDVTIKKITSATPSPTKIANSKSKIPVSKVKVATTMGDIPLDDPEKGVDPTGGESPDQSDRNGCGNGEDEYLTVMKRCLFLGICYSANIGGTGTVTGTGTNLIMYGMLSDRMSFSSWMVFSTPGMMVNITIAWLFIGFLLMRSVNQQCPSSAIDGSTESTGSSGSIKKKKKEEDPVNQMIQNRWKELGSIKFEQIAVFVLFLLLIVLWFFRNPQFMRGWSKLVLPPNVSPNFVGDSVPALLVTFLFFIIPKNPMKSPAPLLTWKTVERKMSWSIMILLGGGFALSTGAKRSGLSLLLGQYLSSSLQGFSLIGVQVTTCLMALVLTEVASNVTTATILLGVVENVASSMGMDPLLIMVPITLCCSYAFLLPVASPSNAIIFEAGNMEIKHMFAPGLFLKVACFVTTLIFITVWAPITLT